MHQPRGEARTPSLQGCEEHSSVVKPQAVVLVTAAALADAACNYTSTLSFLLLAEGSRWGKGKGNGGHPRKHSRWGYSPLTPWPPSKPPVPTNLHKS